MMTKQRKRRLALLFGVMIGVLPTTSFSQTYGWDCRPKCVDAGVQWDQRTRYLFKGAEYISFSGDEPEDGYPRPIAGNWTGFPVAWASGIDAAVTWGNGRIFFFRGNQYIRYQVQSDGNAVHYGARPIASNWTFPALWASGINAGINWGNGKVYFFRGSQYLRYDVASERVDPGFPRAIADNWPGFPGQWSSGVDAAANWSGDAVYFFRGKEYLRYNVGPDGSFRSFGVKRIADHWSVFEEALRPDLNETVVRVPVSVTGLHGITRAGDIILTHYRPKGAGPFPAVVYSHGRRPYNRAWPARYREADLASFWVQKGFAFFYATRLGYGATGLEPDVESAGGVCAHEPGVRVAVAQIIAVTSYARSQPFVDKKKILLIGNSSGGLATIVVSGMPSLDGVVAAINLSGGVGGGINPERPCNEPEIRRLFAEAGREAKIPSLWLYAMNDSLWGPNIPRQWYEAHVKSGGRASFHMFPPVGSDGHNLKNHIEIWAPIAREFIAKVGLIGCTTSPCRH